MAPQWNFIKWACTSFRKSSKNVDGRPGLVHRIDKDTSGLLVAKTSKALTNLSQQFHQKQYKENMLLWFVSLKIKVGPLMKHWQEIKKTE